VKQFKKYSGLIIAQNITYVYINLEKRGKWMQIKETNQFMCNICNSWSNDRPEMILTALRQLTVCQSCYQGHKRLLVV